MVKSRIAAQSVTVALVGLFATACSTPEASIKTADTYFNAGDYQHARVIYSQQIRKDGRSGAAYYGLGRTLLRLGDRAGAAAAFRRAVETLPGGSAEARNSRVQMAYCLVSSSSRPEDQDEVERVGSELCRADPQSFDGRRLLGALAFQRALLVKDTDADRSKLYLDDAFNQYRIAAALKPRDLEILLGFARLLAVRGDLPGAELLFSKGLSLDPGNPTLYGEIYRVLLLEGKPAEAKGMLRQATGRVASPLPFWAMLVAQTISKDASGLPAMLAELMASRIHGAHLIAGDAWFRIGKLNEALPEYNKCLAESSSSGTCRNRLLQVALSSGNQAEAARLKNEILSKDPRSSEAQIADALIKIQSNDLLRAESEIQAVTLQDPQNAEAYYHLARIHMINGAPQQAEQELGKAIQLRPGFRSALLALAELQFALGEYASARKNANDLRLAVGNCGPVHNILEASDRARDSAQPPGSAVRDLVQKLGTVQADIAGEYLADSNVSAEHSDAGRGMSSGTSLPCTIDLRFASDPTGIHFRDSALNDAIETFGLLSNPHYDTWVFAAPVPGHWK